MEQPKSKGLLCAYNGLRKPPHLWASAESLHHQARLIHIQGVMRSRAGGRNEAWHSAQVRARQTGSAPYVMAGLCYDTQHVEAMMLPADIPNGGNHNGDTREQLPNS